MIKLLGAYTNGNYNVLLFEDGTKIRINNKDRLEPAMFESADIKITSMCKNGCPFCYECSTPEGKHADFEKFTKLFDSMHPFTELAIGGGNPLEHPKLPDFLKMLSQRSLVPSMTVRYNDFKDNINMLRSISKPDNIYSKERLLYGLGVSMPTELSDWDNHLLNFLQCTPDAVMHVISGITPVEAIKKYEDKDLKLLILGYKYFGKGNEYSSDCSRMVCKNREEMQTYIPPLIKDRKFKVVSFDNLGLEQLAVQMYFDNTETWNRMYMGGDGEYTLFIDLVAEEFSISSASTIRYQLLPEYTAKDLFEIIHRKKKGIITNLAR